MKIFRTPGDLQDELNLYRGKKSIGLVPTMGALHDGHLSILKHSLKQNAVTVCSIFVNPAQFNDLKDLANYPRDEDKDIQMLKNINCSITFIPDEKDIYPVKKLLDISFGDLENVMEGAFRPGHFKGVANVVKILFDIIKPDVAYFGEKDFQQLMIIKKLVQQFNMNTAIEAFPTVREKDGLAMSSRNIYLNKAERKAAPVIYQSLLLAKKMYHNKIPVGHIKMEVMKKIHSTEVLKVQYFEIVNADTLQPVEENNTIAAGRGCIAVQASDTRLIDNIALAFAE